MAYRNMPDNMRVDGEPERIVSVLEMAEAGMGVDASIDELPTTDSGGARRSHWVDEAFLEVLSEIRLP